MRIGISVTSLHAVDDPRVAAQRMIERAAAARDAGLARLFVGDHHATPAPYMQNVPILARMLAEWDADGRQRPFGALFLLPLWHPVLLAEQVGTLAALGSGPFALQCAIGAGRRQFGSMGVAQRERVGRFEASLEILRALWAGETVDRNGHWPISGGRISPRPPQPVEVIIGASAPPAIERAARLGDAWLASPATDPAGARAELERYREACARHGVTPRASIRKDVFVTERAGEAERFAREVREQGYRGFAPEALAIGTPEQVAEALAAYGEAGFEEVVVRNAASDQGACLETIQALGDIAPRVAAVEPA